MKRLERVPALSFALALLALLTLADCNGDQPAALTPSPRPSPGPSPSPTEPLGEFETVEAGDQSGITGAQPQLLKLDTEAEWEEFWAQHQAMVMPPPELPAVDFSREMVIAAVDKEEPSGGYGFQVAGIVESQGSLLVLVRSEVPGPDCVVTAAVTRPFHIVRLAKSNLEPRLIFSMQTRSCD